MKLVSMASLMERVTIGRRGFRSETRFGPQAIGNDVDE
jgi:hypothetical protein